MSYSSSATVNDTQHAYHATPRHAISPLTVWFVWHFTSCQHSISIVVWGSSESKRMAKAFGNRISKSPHKHALARLIRNIEPAVPLPLPGAGWVGVGSLPPERWVAHRRCPARAVGACSAFFALLQVYLR